MRETLFSVLERLEQPAVRGAEIIPWSSPVLSFGDPSIARVATVGLNPSNREFVDDAGNELTDEMRRFHTLNSLGLRHWGEIASRHVSRILDSFSYYFLKNPYDRWFRVLDSLLASAGVTYYRRELHACHLDLVPFATSKKWTDLSPTQRSSLLKGAGDTLGLLLRESAVEVLVLNGRTVVENLQCLTGTVLEAEQMPRWNLPRQATSDVPGIAYRGCVSSVAGVDLRRRVHVLGFNHNIQSSFGVTKLVKSEISNWLEITCREILA
jgi:hypothetical protein